MGNSGRELSNKGESTFENQKVVIFDVPSGLNLSGVRREFARGGMAGVASRNF